MRVSESIGFLIEWKISFDFKIFAYKVEIYSRNSKNSKYLSDVNVLQLLFSYFHPYRSFNHVPQMND